MQEPATLRAIHPTLFDGSHPNFTISEMALRILAYNLIRVMNIMGSKPLLARISAETAAPRQRTATMALAPTRLRHRARTRSSTHAPIGNPAKSSSNTGVGLKPAAALSIGTT